MFRSPIGSTLRKHNASLLKSIGIGASWWGVNAGASNNNNVDIRTRGFSSSSSPFSKHASTIHFKQLPYASHNSFSHHRFNHHFRYYSTAQQPSTDTATSSTHQQNPAAVTSSSPKQNNNYSTREKKQSESSYSKQQNAQTKTNSALDSPPQMDAEELIREQQQQRIEAQNESSSSPSQQKELDSIPTPEEQQKESVKEVLDVISDAATEQKQKSLLADDFNQKTTSQMLRDLEKKKEDLQLKPREFSDVLADVQAKIVQLVMKIPPLFWKASVFISDRSLEFLKNPLIIKEWGVNTKNWAKKEAKHYWSGGKLFYADVKSALRIVNRVAQGHSISRREKLQLRRATADILRMVPFLAFIVIPFMEAFLPLAIKLFPNMLPSQFEDKLQKEEAVRRKLRARLELAKFLQDTVELMVVDLKKNKNAETVATAQELHKFITAIREGHPVTNEDIVRFAKLFNDELTLDSVERSQLLAMCRFMDIPPYGSDAILRFHLRSKLRQLKADDRLIYWEGVNSLSIEELMFACQERGMRIGLPKKELRRQLNEWLQLSLDFNIPSSLLILSRAFSFTSSNVEYMNPDEAIKMAIGSLPKNAIDEVLMDQHDDDVSMNEKRLESLRRQEKLIEEEEKAESEKRLNAAKDGSNEEDEDIDQHLKEYRKALSTFIDDKSSLRDERRELSALSGEHETVNDELLDDEAHAIKFRRVHEYVGKVIGELEVELDEAQDSISSTYHKLDKNKDGYIDVDELVEANRHLAKKPSPELMEKIIEKLDKNKDGKISVSALRSELLESNANEKFFK